MFNLDANDMDGFRSPWPVLEEPSMVLPEPSAYPLPNNTPVSQYQGLGDMMGKGVAPLNNVAGKIGRFMAKPNMPGVISNLGKMVLAGGGVQGQPVNAIAKGANDMALQKQYADILNKGYTIPKTQQPTITTPSTPVASAVPERPMTRMGSLKNSVFNKKEEELLPPNFMKGTSNWFRG